jgi:hypothetical protein
MLYLYFRNLRGEKYVFKEEDEPTNVVSGVYEGVKGIYSYVIIRWNKRDIPRHYRYLY